MADTPAVVPTMAAVRFRLQSYLRNRTGKRVWHREREQFTFSQTVSISVLSVALDEALATVFRWVAQAGHTRTPA